MTPQANGWRDPNLDRKDAILTKALVQQEAQIPLVSLFEISLSGLCNRQCPFCPRADHRVYPNLNEFIAPSLHTKMMRELGEFHYAGLISYSGYSEPLIHQGIDQLVAQARQHCPHAKIEIYSNGDFLTVELIRRLYRAGLTSMLVSLYDGPHQAAHFTKMREEAGVSEAQLILRERYLLDAGAGMHLSNRAGTIDFDRMKIRPLKEPLTRKCHLPFYMMMVDHTGEVFLCSHDWIKKFVVGDLRTQTILEVWNGPTLKAARQRLALGDRRFGPCAQCDIDGTKIGASHFKKWMGYYAQARTAAPAA
jgi:2-deoxy-scyllo-inosamine dehydrogenase (SAM-dependent)